MKSGYIFFIALLLSGISWGQTISEVIFPKYMQGAGTFNAADEQRVPFVCRLTISGLAANTEYRYFNRFIKKGSSVAEGTFIFSDATGNFVRVTSPTFFQSGKYATFTTDATGAYTGWFMNEVGTSSLFLPGNTVYLRVTLNKGGSTTATGAQPETTSGVTVGNFHTNTSDTSGTALRSTPVTGGTAKNFVFLWSDPAGTGRPETGTFIESDGTDNTIANGYAPFYANYVNGIDKAWGNIIPNKLPDGIKRIGQFRLTDGAEVGHKISSNATWPATGGGRVSTVNPAGGVSTIIVLDGSAIRLDGANLKSDQTITFTGLPSTTYGDADFDPGATTTTDLPVTYTSSNTSVATIVNGKIHITGAGTTEIKAYQTGDDFFNAAAPVAVSLVVNQAKLTITAKDDQIVQGDPMPVLKANYTGFVNGESETNLTRLPVISTAATSSSNPGDYDIFVKDAASPNYDIAYVKGKFTITAGKQPQSITFNALPSATYGDADVNLYATATSQLPVAYSSNNTQVAVIVNGKIHIVGAGTTTITASQAGASAWLPAADVSRLFEVKKAALTIKADNKTRKVGQPNPPLTVTYTGFVYAENNTVLTAQPFVNTDADRNSLAGPYDIKVSSAAAANYDIGYKNGTLTVEPLTVQTITLAALPVKKYGDADFKVAATASSQLPVTYSSSNVAVATVQNDGTIHIVGAGTTSITATQKGNDTYAAASETRLFTIQKATLDIQAESVTRLEGEPNPALKMTYTGFVKNENASVLTSLPVAATTATNSSVAGNYPITVQGANAANYNIAHLNGTLTVLSATAGTEQPTMTAYINAPGQMVVNIYAVNKGRSVVQLFDINGGCLINREVTLVKGYNTVSIPVAGVASGVYNLRVAAADVLLKQKVIIQ